MKEEGKEQMEGMGLEGVYPAAEEDQPTADNIEVAHRCYFAWGERAVGHGDGDAHEARLLDPAEKPD